MAVNTLQKSFHSTETRNRPLADRFLWAYRENQAETACGLLAIHYAPNAYPLYKWLHR